MSPYESMPAQSDTLVRRVELRNPFRILDLPLVGRLCRAAYTPRRRVAKRFVGKPAKLLFRFAHRTLNIGGQGTMQFEGPDGERALRFDARNIQFRALYLPQYTDGYETETSALLDVIVRPTDVFFDVGANWGYVALWVASRAGIRGSGARFRTACDHLHRSIRSHRPSRARAPHHLPSHGTFGL